VRLLLDTRVFLWLANAPTRLNRTASDLLADQANDLFLSSASSWEIAIKHSRGKLPLPIGPARFVLSRMQRFDITGLAVEHVHALHVAGLPHHHSDPFDRLIVAQAQLEGFSLATADRRLAAYDVPVLWAD
jgi:PIN domain nuclease of toxin-antitoxin system